jgi:ABC-type nitrate/sulfonate/bicarbonate transport system substrate-binding protein
MAGLPFHIAKAKGFFESQNLEVEEKSMSTANLGIESLIRGDIDVMITTPIQTVLPVNNLQPNKFKIFSQNSDTINYDAIIVKSSSSYQSLADLKNKKIGVLPGSTATNIMKAYAKSKNIEMGTAEYVQLAANLQLQALEAGSIDGLLAYEPTLSVAMEQGKFKKISGSIAYEDPSAPIATALISQKLLDQKPDIAKRVIAAYDKAIYFIDQNELETRGIITTVYKLDPTISNKIGLSKNSLSTNMNAFKVQQYADYLFSIGEVKDRVDVGGLFYIGM